VTLAGFVLALWNLTKVWQRSKQISDFPTIRSLGISSEQEARQKLDVVNEDLSFDSSKLSNSIRTGKRYALQQKRYKLDLLDMQDIAWFYKKVVNKKIYYVIPAGTSHSVQVNTLSGQSQEWAFGGKSNLSDQFLAQLVQAAPWAVVGYDAQIKKMWDKGRKNFLAQVLARKQEHTQPIQPESQLPASQ
jgi:hypothetical protein